MTLAVDTGLGVTLGSPKERGSGKVFLSVLCLSLSLRSWVDTTEEEGLCNKPRRRRREGTEPCRSWRFLAKEGDVSGHMTFLT